MPQPDDIAETFNRLRPRLIRIAYRMLGSVAEAEDIVQEGFIRWHQADRSDVRSEEAFLVRTITRLCLDHLKSARVRRETYVGNWLPEPIFDPSEDESDSDITLTLMMALERFRHWSAQRSCCTMYSVRISTRFPKQSAVIRRRADNLRAGRATTSRKQSRVFRFRTNKAKISPMLSSTHHVVVTCKPCSLYWQTTSFMYADGGGIRPAVINPIYMMENVCLFFGDVLPAARRTDCRQFCMKA